MKHRLCALGVALVPLLLLFGAPVHAASHKSSKILDLSDSVAKAAILTKFSALVQASGLATFLSSRGPFTLFVPVNSAFSKLPPGMFEDLLRPENQQQLQRVILFHLVNGKTWDARDLQPIKSLPSCEGSPLAIRSSKAGTQFVGKARILRADIKCANGIIHQIDTMLMPAQVVLVAQPVEVPATNAAPAPPAKETPPKPAASMRE